MFPRCSAGAAKGYGGKARASTVLDNFKATFFISVSPILDSKGASDS